MSVRSHRFCLADVEVELRVLDPRALATPVRDLAPYPSSGEAPALIVEIEPGLEAELGAASGAGPEAARNAAPEASPEAAGASASGPADPRFSRRQIGPDLIELSRFDALGQVALPAEENAPVTARFRTSAHAHALEGAVQSALGIAMLHRGRVMLHASAVIAGGRALVFAGPSGIGKSTIGALLAREATDCVRLTDDLTVLAPSAGGGWAAHAAPFAGETDLSRGASAPVAAIHILEQAPHAQRHALSQGDAARGLLQSVVALVAESRMAQRALDAAAQLAEAVSCYRLAFAPDRSVLAALGLRSIREVPVLDDAPT